MQPPSGSRYRAGRTGNPGQHRAVAESGCVTCKKERRVQEGADRRGRKPLRCRPFQGLNHLAWERLAALRRCAERPPSAGRLIETQRAPPEVAGRIASLSVGPGHSQPTGPCPQVCAAPWQSARAGGRVPLPGPVPALQERALCVVEYSAARPRLAWGSSAEKGTVPWSWSIASVLTSLVSRRAWAATRSGPVFNSLATA